MNTTLKRDHDITGLFKSAKDWEARYRIIIKEGRNLPILETEKKQDRFLVKGCQSRVWLYPEFKDGLVFFEGDSDALITKGLLALVLRYYSQLSPEEILKNPPQFIEKLNLTHHLTPSRSNGLMSLIKQVKLYAKAYELTKSNSEEQES